MIAIPEKLCDIEKSNQKAKAIIAIFKLVLATMQKHKTWSRDTTIQSMTISDIWHTVIRFCIQRANVDLFVQ